MLFPFFPLAIAFSFDRRKRRRLVSSPSSPRETSSCSSALPPLVLPTAVLVEMVVPGKRVLTGPGSSAATARTRWPPPPFPQHVAPSCCWWSRPRARGPEEALQQTRGSSKSPQRQPSSYGTRLDEDAGKESCGLERTPKRHKKRTFNF